jgi:hypothetical protein
MFSAEFFNALELAKSTNLSPNEILSNLPKQSLQAKM